MLDVLPIVVIAVVAATVAALVPAFGASRVSVLTALAGRRPLGRVSRRRTALGLASIAAGTGLLAVAAYVDRDGSAGGSGRRPPRAPSPDPCSCCWASAPPPRRT